MFIANFRSYVFTFLWQNIFSHIDLMFVDFGFSGNVDSFQGDFLQTTFSYFICEILSILVVIFIIFFFAYLIYKIVIFFVRRFLNLC